MTNLREKIRCCVVSKTKVSQNVKLMSLSCAECQDVTLQYWNLLVEQEAGISQGFQGQALRSPPSEH